MNTNIGIKASLLLLVATTVTSCGGSHKTKIIETINKEASYQATQPAPDPADRVQNLQKIMTGFSKYTQCINSLLKDKKLKPNEAADLIGFSDNSEIKIDSEVVSDIRMAKVYSAVTDKFCK